MSVPPEGKAVLALGAGYFGTGVLALLGGVSDAVATILAIFGALVVFLLTYARESRKRLPEPEPPKPEVWGPERLKLEEQDLLKTDPSLWIKEAEKAAELEWIREHSPADYYLKLIRTPEVEFRDRASKSDHRDVMKYADYVEKVMVVKNFHSHKRTFHHYYRTFKHGGWIW